MTRHLWDDILRWAAEQGGPILLQFALWWWDKAVERWLGG